MTPVFVRMRPGLLPLHHRSHRKDGDSEPRSHWEPDLDCLEHLNLDFHELQLMRIETRSPRHEAEKWSGFHERRGPRIEILLGDIHTETRRRRKYRPTALQPDSLIKTSQVVVGDALSLVFLGRVQRPHYFF